jgi:tetratricopeptide (TPR) repeat protein
MKCIEKIRWPLAWLAVLAVAGESLTALAQPPATPMQQPAALQQTGTAAAATPQFQPTPEQMGDSLMAHQRYQAAIDAYKNAPRDSSEAWNKMGVAYQLLYNTDDAARCYQAAIKLDPKNSVYMNNIGSVYMARKLYATAEKAYRKASKLDPHSALIQKNLGTALLAQRRYKKGWEAYQAAIALDPDIFDHSTSVRIENPGSIQDRGAMNYYMAKGCVRAGMNIRAVEYLRMALNEGFTTPKKIIADSEFAALHNVPAFQEMLAAQGVYLTDPNVVHPTIRQ